MMEATRVREERVTYLYEKLFPRKEPKLRNIEIGDYVLVLYQKLSKTRTPKLGKFIPNYAGPIIVINILGNNGGILEVETLHGPKIRSRVSAADVQSWKPPTIPEYLRLAKLDELDEFRNFSIPTNKEILMNEVQKRGHVREMKGTMSPKRRRMSMENQDGSITEWRNLESHDNLTKKGHTQEWVPFNPNYEGGN